MIQCNFSWVWQTYINCCSVFITIFSLNQTAATATVTTAKKTPVNHIVLHAYVSKIERENISILKYRGYDSDVPFPQNSIWHLYSLYVCIRLCVCAYWPHRIVLIELYTHSSNNFEFIIKSHTQTHTNKHISWCGCEHHNIYFTAFHIAYITQWIVQIHLNI